MKIFFCPNCKVRIIPPRHIENIKLEGTGKIKINCGNCNKDGNGNPKGIIVIKPKKEEVIK